MKTLPILALLLFLGLLSPRLDAADGGSHTYQSEVAGMMCSACAAKIKAAFSTMEGVKSVDVKAGKSGAPPSVIVVSSSAGLTQEDAVKALGEDAKTFVVQSFVRQD